MHLMRELDRRAIGRFRIDVDRRFDKVDQRFDKVEGEVRELRSEMKTGFETIHRTMVQGIIALSASFIAGFAAMVTQL
jgi:hypothetical protein